MKRETLIWIAIMVVAGGYLAYRAAVFHNGAVYVRQVNGQDVPATAWEASAGIAHVSIKDTIGVWVAALFTLFIFSFLYRDNPLYKLAEAVVVGVSAAYWMVIAFWTTLIPNLFGKLFPSWVKSWAMPDLSEVRESGWYLYFIPLVLGVLLLWRLAPKGGWIARWPLAFIIGATAGIRLVGYFMADFLSQIRSSIMPLVEMQPDSSPSVGNIDYWGSLANLTLIAGVVCCLVYFFFSVEHKGAVGRVAKVGIWFLMITFGAAFGYTVMGRIALLAIRMEFLFDNWLWLIDPLGVRPPGWTGWW